MGFLILPANCFSRYYFIGNSFVGADLFKYIF
jgi:hypothetical protein